MLATALHGAEGKALFSILNVVFLCFRLPYAEAFLTIMGEIKVSPDYNWFRSTVPLKKVRSALSSSCAAPSSCSEGEDWAVGLRLTQDVCAVLLTQLP